MTERAVRRPVRDRSADSGLSSPGSNLSRDDTSTTDDQYKMTRHMSIDMMEMNKHKLYSSVCDLQAEAQEVQHIVDNLSSTQTMRRRRTASAGLSITARKQRATESIGSYIPIAPAESEWGHRFDEMITRLRSCEPSANDAHICSAGSCGTDCPLSDSRLDATDTVAAHSLDVPSLAPDKSEEILITEQTLDVCEHKPDTSDLQHIPHTLQQTLETSEENIPSELEQSSNMSAHGETADVSEHMPIIPTAHVSSDQELYDDNNGTEDSVPDSDVIGPLETTIEQTDDSINNNLGYKMDPNVVDDNQLRECEELEIVPVCSEELLQGAHGYPTLDSDRMCQSLCEDRSNGTHDPEMKSLLRSISIHRPDIASYNTPVGALRRTDSNNDVWRERPPPSQRKHQSSVSLAASRTSKPSRPVSRWRSFTRLFSFRSKKQPKSAIGQPEVSVG